MRLTAMRDGSRNPELAMDFVFIALGLALFAGFGLYAAYLRTI